METVSNDRKDDKQTVFVKTKRSATMGGIVAPSYRILSNR